MVIPLLRGGLHCGLEAARMSYYGGWCHPAPQGRAPLLPQRSRPPLRWLIGHPAPQGRAPLRLIDMSCPPSSWRVHREGSQCLGEHPGTGQRPLFRRSRRRGRPRPGSADPAAVTPLPASTTISTRSPFMTPPCSPGSPRSPGGPDFVSGRRGSRKSRMLVLDRPLSGVLSCP
jgi:hypothetical protein